MLAFDIAQFFLFLNHCLLPLILKKAGYDSKVVQFFSNYLVGRKMWYCWNNISSQFFNVDVGVEQDSTLSLILSALYISPVFHILENCLKNLKIPVSVLSSVDNGWFVIQSKSLMISNSLLFCSYNTVFSLLEKFDLILEYGKTEVFYFSRLYRVFNPPPLNLLDIGSVKIVDNGLDFYFSLFISFYLVLFFFYFSIFRTTQVRVYQSHCHISHKWMA